jgi:hypothetical protein
MQTQATPQDRVDTPVRDQIAVPAAPVREDVFTFILRDCLDAPLAYLGAINVPGGGE